MIRIACLLVTAAVALPANVFAQQDFDSNNFFKRLDKNNNGVLTKDDMSDQRLELFRQLLRRGDANSDEELSRDEFMRVLRNRQGNQPSGQNVNRSRSTGRGSFGRGASGGGPRGGSFRPSTPDVGDSLPDITGYDSQGQPFNLSHLKGSYTVLVFGCLT